MKKPSKAIIVLQGILTLIGAATSVVMALRLFQGSPDLLSVLNSVIFLAAYFFMCLYGFVNYKGDDRHFRIAVYAYAALLGIEILFAGNLMADMGLGETVTLVVNVCNLISFAFVIQFVNILEDTPRALRYIGAACGIKLLIEGYLIISMWQYIQIIHILTALAVPVLGFTMMVAYAHRYGND